MEDKEIIINKIRELYKNLMYFPCKILDIFNDFYGEERVDMQGFLDFDEFLKDLCSHPIRYFFETESEVYSTTEFISSSIETKNAIIELVNNGALNSYIDSSVELATYFTPLLTSRIIESREGFILIHFPKVRITNENGRYTDITHLWVKVPIKMNGLSKGYFTMNRSEYSVAHLKSNYLHSHVNGIPFGVFSEFRWPCLGSGPIRDTIITLSIGFNEPVWNLFCLELDKYVRVESLSGIPYKSLERITEDNLIIGEEDFSMCNVVKYTKIDITFIRDFIRYIIRNKNLKFNYVQGSYGFAMSYIDFRILISNEFISWYNEKYNAGLCNRGFTELLNDGILCKCIIDNKIYYISNVSNNDDISKYEGEYICTFKNEPITLHILQEDKPHSNNVLLVDNGLVEYIARAILIVVNYKYGQEREIEENGVSASTIYL